MLVEEALNSFVLSRKQGVSGARGEARPRTIAAYQYDLVPFVHFLQERGVLAYEQVKKSDIMAYIDGMGNQKWSVATKLKVLRSLRAFFSWVERDEDCQNEGLKSWRSALPAISKTPSRKFVPERAAVKKFMASIDVSSWDGLRDYVAMSLMLDTGMRIGELALLTTDDLKLEDRRLIVPLLGKTGTRLLTVSSDMCRLLRLWLKKRGSRAQSKYVFPSRSGKQANSNTFGQMFRRYREKSGVVGITPHTLRHCFCTYFLEGGGDIAKLQALTGHSSLEMLKGYINLSGQSLQEEQERVSPLRQVKTAKGSL